MKTTNLFIKEGRVCCTDKEVPEEPKKVNCGGTHACTCAGLAFESGANRDVVDGYDDNCPYRHAAAIQLIKDNAVPFSPEDQDHAQKLLGFRAEEDTFYPVSVEVEIGDSELCKYCNKSKDGHYHDTVLNRYACKAGDLVAALCTFHPQTVARIVEEPVEKKPNDSKPDWYKKYHSNHPQDKPLLDIIQKLVSGELDGLDFIEWVAAYYIIFPKSEFKDFITANSKQNSQVEDQEPKDVIDFATWYSGMEREKVINAYKRYQREGKKP